MCTITYLPTSEGYVITQNRDESPLREPALFPRQKNTERQKLLFPKDPEGSGSWFVSEKSGTTACIMNGVYHSDKTSADFKHSRGLVPFHFFEYKSVETFLNNYAFEGIQGFTLIVVSADSVHKIHWNEVSIDHQSYAPQPLIFQSNPLYNPEQKAMRRSWFLDWIKNNPEDSILDFHKHQRQDNPTESILMDRQIVKTVSIIQRHFSPTSGLIKYAELENIENFQKVSF